MKDCLIYPILVIIGIEPLTVFVLSGENTQGGFISALFSPFYFLASCLFLGITYFVVKEKQKKKSISWTYTAVTGIAFMSLALLRSTESHM